MADAPATAPPAASPTTVFVRNLPWATTSDELRGHFGAAGSVVTATVAALPSGRSKGHGLVEFATPAEAQAAVDQLNGSQIGERTVEVRADRGPTLKTDRARPPRRGGQRGGPRRPAPDAPPPARSGGDAASVFVRNLAWVTKDEGLLAHFQAAGAVTSAKVAAFPSGRSKGHGLVTYATPGEASNAIATLNHSSLDGRVVETREDRGSIIRAPTEGGEAAPAAAAGPGGGAGGRPRRRRAPRGGRGEGGGAGAGAGPAPSADAPAGGSEGGRGGGGRRGGGRGAGGRGRRRARGRGAGGPAPSGAA